MTNEQLKEFIQNITAGVEFSESQQMLVVVVPAENINGVAKALKESTSTKFDYLYSLTGVDINSVLGVVYHLESSIFGHKVVLKAFAADRINPVIPTISDLWDGAELQEREVFDFFGISFKNHPDMRRLFMEDDWVGFPLRKDYKDEVNIIDLIK